MEMSEEELSKMSPEQIRALQKENCIFCQIISGKVQSRRVYEDDKVLAILDINPANPGHILLLPKEHYAILPQMPDELVGYIFSAAKQLSRALIKAFNVSGSTIFAANGAIAGQRAPHFMVHIIPRYPEDGISALKIPSKQVTENEISEISRILKPRISAAFGISAGEPINLDKPAERIVQKVAQKEKIPSEKKEGMNNADLDKASSALFRQIGGL